MELDELRSAWISNNEKLEQRIRINEAQIERIQKQRAVSNLAPLYRQKIVEMVFHGIVIGLLLIFICQHFFQPLYLISACALLGFYITLFAQALSLARIISRMDFNQDLATLQGALTILQTRILNYAKLTLLFIPAFLSYPVVVGKAINDLGFAPFAEFDVIAQSKGNWWNMQLVVFLVIIPLGIWFYREVTYKNIHKKWVRDFIRKSTGKRVEKAMEFLNELQELQH